MLQIMKLKVDLEEDTTNRSGIKSHVWLKPRLN